MAEIIEGGGGHDKGGKKRPKKSPVRMDMTPMVDLAFLLLTFFILATSRQVSRIAKSMRCFSPSEKEEYENASLYRDLMVSLNSSSIVKST